MISLAFLSWGPRARTSTTEKERGLFVLRSGNDEPLVLVIKDAVVAEVNIAALCVT
jgi:hypothetical protein